MGWAVRRRFLYSASKSQKACLCSRCFCKQSQTAPYVLLQEASECVLCLVSCLRHPDLMQVLLRPRRHALGCLVGGTRLAYPSKTLFEPYRDYRASRLKKPRKERCCKLQRPNYSLPNRQSKMPIQAGLLTGSGVFPNVDFGGWLVNDRRIANQPPEIVSSASIVSSSPSTSSPSSGWSPA